ncbi:phosphoglycerate kinase [Halobaculum sp. MBLA0147]|uniref:phosphoglycerate kinase n=1 Tax=Halobaculum sp. MBLA0147 TaxID=3079934 RepID=UPI00352335F3
MAAFRTLDDLDAGQRVLCRLDLNSPVEDGAVQDNRRFDRHAETVSELHAADHRVALLAHQGRPGRDTFVGLEQHAEILSEHAGVDVTYVPDTYGEEALAAIRETEPGDVLLLENTRMVDAELPEESPETKADTEFVRTLAAEVDAYVNDAYSAAHRSHASLVGFPRVLPSYAGRVMATEYEANTAIAAREFDGEVTMVVGGTKATDVIEVMEALGDRVDTFLLGGVAGELFLRAAGYPVGEDVDAELFDEQWAANGDTVERVLEEYGDAVRLADDLAYADADGDRAEIGVEEIDTKETDFLDVGGSTVAEYQSRIHRSEAVFVKGALGVFEDERFADGTVGVLEAIAETDCFSVVGGGDTSRAIELYGLDEADFSHVSIAGGAYIRALTGQELVGVAELERSAESDGD